MIDVARKVASEAKEDNMPLLAAGVAFYSVLALFPALVAVVSIYGLVADPDDVTRQLQGLASAVPEEVADILIKQATSIAAADSGALGLSAFVGIAVALWGASSGMTWMMRALTLIFDEDETRKFVALRGRALVLTFAATLAMVVSVGLIAGASDLGRWIGLVDVGRTIVTVVRWPVLALVMVVGLNMLYRYGPDRHEPIFRWFSWGAVIGAAVWIGASVGFAAYVSVVGSNESYGSLAGVAVLMLWLWLTCLAILLGAQVNSVLERSSGVGRVTPTSTADGPVVEVELTLEDEPV